MQSALENAGLFAFFAAEPDLLIYSSEVHLTKNSPEIFQLACRRAGLKSQLQHCLFVGEDANERNFARAAGCQVAASLEAALEPLEHDRTG
jgi:FMN phosphatase YigB (HAD superfamily)